MFLPSDLSVRAPLQFLFYSVVVVLIWKLCCHYILKYNII